MPPTLDRMVSKSASVEVDFTSREPSTAFVAVFTILSDFCRPASPENDSSLQAMSASSEEIMSSLINVLCIPYYLIAFHS